MKAKDLLKADLVSLVDEIRDTVRESDEDVYQAVEGVKELLTSRGIEVARESEWAVRIKVKSKKIIEVDTARWWIHDAMAHQFSLESCLFGEMEFDEAFESIEIEELTDVARS